MFGKMNNPYGLIEEDEEVIVPNEQQPLVPPPPVNPVTPEVDLQQQLDSNKQRNALGSALMNIGNSFAKAQDPNISQAFAPVQQGLQQRMLDERKSLQSASEKEKENQRFQKILKSLGR